MTIRSLLILALLAGCASLSASGFQSLESGVDARSAALGFTLATGGGDPVAGFGNPAALVQGPGRTVSFTLNHWAQAVQSGHAGLVFSGQDAAFGLSLYYSEIGEIEHRIVPSRDPIGTFSAHDFVTGLSYGLRVLPGVSAGVSLRSYYQKIYLEDAWGLGGDLGVLWSLPDRMTRIGGAVQHVGRSGVLKNERIALPTTFRIGASRTLALSSLSGMVLVEAVVERDAPFHFHTGVELVWDELLCLRAGYLSGYETRNVTFGAGFRFRHYALDYTVAPFQSGLGDMHLLSALFLW